MAQLLNGSTVKPKRRRSSQIIDYTDFWLYRSYDLMITKIWLYRFWLYRSY